MKALKFTGEDFYTHGLSFQERARVAEIAQDIYTKWLTRLITEMLSYAQGCSLLAEESMKELIE